MLWFEKNVVPIRVVLIENRGCLRASF